MTSIEREVFITIMVDKIKKEAIEKVDQIPNRWGEAELRYYIAYKTAGVLKPFEYLTKDRHLRAYTRDLEDLNL